MRTALLRCCLLLVLWLGAGLLSASATHLLGGEMNYRYLDANGPAATPFRYRVTVLIYVNADPVTSQVPQGRPSIDVGFYNKSQNGALISRITIGRISNNIITPPQPGGCSIPTGTLSVRLCRYETVVNLPVSFDGYYAVYSDGNRNVGITNLANSDQYAQLIYVEMAPPLLPNASPTFSDTAVVVVCQGDTSILVNNAVDPDGDRLIYSFSRPYGGSQAGGGANLPTVFAGNPATVPYANGYSQAAPFGTGAGAYAYLNASNGLSRYAAPMLGSYVVAVEVKEYRTINGVEVLIGSTRREIQLVARTCQPNNAPAFTSATQTAPHIITVEEGQPVSFTLAARDPDANPINLKANSVLLDGTGGFDATFAGNVGTVVPGNPTGSATIQGTGGNVSGQFVFNTRCGNARNTPYDVVVTATDVTCGAKSVADIFQIYVTRASGPNRITGDTVICDRAAARTYTAGGPAASSYQWIARGGTIQGSSTGNSVQVVWTTSGTGRLVLRGVSAFGCSSDSVVRNIDVRPAGTLAVTPSLSICPGSPTTLTATGGLLYTWTSSTGQTFTGPSITVTPAATTTYTVTTSDGVCTTTRQTTVTVNPAAVANAGPDQAPCAQDQITLGAPAQPGYTYQWSPATGLSSSTTAQPSFSLPNSGTISQVYTYVLTATTAQGCVARDTVRVTSRPVAIANPGPGVALCLGDTVQLGTPALPGYTYSWTSTTSIRILNPTAAQPLAVSTQTGSAILTGQATLTATNAQGCSATVTVQVTSNPNLFFSAGADRTICNGGPTTLGEAPLPVGQTYTYQWSPAANLSSTTVAQPVFTPVNPGTTPLTVRYILTVTSQQGCSRRDTVTITVNPTPPVNAGPDVALCDRQQVRLGAAAVTGYTYQWSPAANLSSATAAQPFLTATNTTANPLTLTYVLTATNLQGCVGRDTVRIVVNPRPAADSIQGSRSVCPTVQGVAYSIRNAQGTAYQWLVTGGTIASGQGTSAITVNWGAATATASVRAFRLNSFGCSSDTFALPVRVNQQLSTQTPTGPLRVCLNAGPFTYQTQYTNGSVYGWQIIGGTQVSTNQASVVVNWTRTGLVKLVVTESSNPAGGVCRGVSDTLYVNVLPAPAANLAITGPDRVCASTANLIFSLPGATGSTYAFTLNGTAVTGVGNTVSLPTPVASSTPYTLTIRETNASGCVGQVYTKTFLVVPPLAITGPASYCPEARTGLRYTATTLTGGQYQWTITGGTIASGQGTGTVTVDIPTGSSNATLSVTETTSQSCAATFTIRPDNATVALSAASVVPTSQDRSITLALTVPNNTGNANQVQIRRRDAGSTGAYTTVGTLANTATSFTDPNVDADTKAYQYQLNLTNACGTVLSSQEHTTILTKAVATQSTGGRDVGKVQISWTAYQGFPVQEYRITRVADNGTSELVSTVSGTTLSLELPTSTAGFSQCFRVQALSAEATPRTSASNDACVAFENKLGFYNIITPNGDGKNDVLVIDNVTLYPSNTLTIFNRWGKQVYQTRNYRNDYGGQEQSAGMYYYLFKLDDGTTYKGWFEITR